MRSEVISEIAPRRWKWRKQRFSAGNQMCLRSVKLPACGKTRAKNKSPSAEADGLLFRSRSGSYELPLDLERELNFARQASEFGQVADACRSAVGVVET